MDWSIKMSIPITKLQWVMTYKRGSGFFAWPPLFAILVPIEDNLVIKVRNRARTITEMPTK